MPAVIDIHHHILPDFFFRETNGDAHPVGGLAPAPLSEARALEFMDDAGIDVAIKSISTPRVHVGDDARVRSLGTPEGLSAHHAAEIEKWWPCEGPPSGRSRART
jgi:hypothetical protein